MCILIILKEREAKPSVPVGGILCLLFFSALLAVMPVVDDVKNSTFVDIIIVNY